jgi:hypothetical protein
MTLEYVYFVSQIMSATGVLLSLIYLSLQIRTNTRELQSQGYYNALALAQRPMEILVESESLGRVVNEGYARPEALSTQDWHRFATWNLMHFDGWEYLFYQARSSAVPENLWLGADAYFKGLVNTKPGLARFWSEYRVAFAEPFRSHVEASFR